MPQLWAADIDISSIDIPVCREQNDPSSVYSKNSAARVSLLRMIAKVVRSIPEGEEAQKRYAHTTILNCSTRTPKEFPERAYRHLHALCVSKVIQNARSQLARIQGSVSAIRI